MTVSTPLDTSGLILTGAGFDQDVRWSPGERLEDLFAQRCAQTPDQLAVDAPGTTLTFAELDGRANQLARHLLEVGIALGRRVALMFDDAAQAYVAMLAVLKAGAAYVPLDPGFPADRMAYIIADAEVSVVLSLSHLGGLLTGVGVPVVCIDTAGVEARDPGPVSASERGPAVDPLAYLIYTSGSTGRPKGVAVEHGGICNFVRVAAEAYGIRPDDRMYQGLTIAFDFSVEEIWVPWIAGATLVPKPPGSALLGAELHEYLVAQRVSAMCCVPTLLATVEDDVPGLRFLLVSGEACPHDLIVRWHRPGRRFLNVYGPTEATVTATWTAVHPDRAVTIGVPLPTYSTVILDPEAPTRALPPGQIGEIGIAGIGLAAGYVNRPDLTDAAFVPDFLGIPRNPSGRIYRTGDLGRVNDDGEIEYHGRIDLQVKIRGYRIELTEIESVLLQVPGVAQAVVDTYEPVPGTVELVGYYSLRSDGTGLDAEVIRAVLRERLPGYMVPAYLEHLDVVPLTTQGKADRRNLPAPTARCAAMAGSEHVAPDGPTETALAGLLAQTLGLEQVSVTAHFFDDLGANSLLLAQYCTRIRKHADLPGVSTKQLYLNPTIRTLATAIPVGAGTGSVVADPPAQPRAGTLRYLACGGLQVLLAAATGTAVLVLAVLGLRWTAQATDLVGVYQRSVVFGLAAFVLALLVPVTGKWLLVGRFKPTPIPLWSLRYVRFWFVKSLMRTSPLVLLAGSPLYVLYLRALGAKIGRGAAVFSTKMPACPDLLTIGAGTVVRSDVALYGYRAVAGRIETGRVQLGRDVVVGDASVLDIDVSMEDGAQLGHASCLHSGQVVPAGQRWHGSPAQPTMTDFRLVPPRRCGALRRVVFSCVQLALLVGLLGPIGLGLVVLLLTRVPYLVALLGPGHDTLLNPAAHAIAASLAAGLLVGGLLLGLVSVLTVPRLLNLFIRPDKAYPLYGFHYWIQQAITALTNTMFTRLLGDSVFVTGFLGALGYRLRPVEQTGSNFGLIMKHATPYLSSIGTGTMISDGLTIANVDYSSTSFRVGRVAVGRRNFLGNHITVPASSRVGDNCLIATRAMVPIDGQVRRDVGLLGSPAFEIPRSVQRDARFDRFRHPDQLRWRLRAKTRHNTVSILLHLLVVGLLLVAAVVAALAAVDLYSLIGVWSLPAAGLALFVLTFATLVVVERAATRFRPLRPTFCSIYQPSFWRHERFWKLTTTSFFDIFNGTPFKGFVWRLLGVRIGRRVFDDGCSIPEKSLVTVGDDCVLGAGSSLWCHTLEDGTFKSDRITVGDACTLGVGAFALYGVTLGAGSRLDADAFLLKGEEVPAGARWSGNPAAEVQG
ncbi:MAG: amino acid adenylation domain-containing protein [Pseudonocardia sp.]|nr:amino acid adenylation domain-containing protein [Pseudonocardia sp.]